MPNGAAEPGTWRGSFNPKQLLKETTQGRVASLKTRCSDLMNDPRGAWGHMERQNGTDSGRGTENSKNCTGRVEIMPPTSPKVSLETHACSACENQSSEATVLLTVPVAVEEHLDKSSIRDIKITVRHGGEVTAHGQDTLHPQPRSGEQ